MNDLRERTALVIGGTHGMGLATAKLLLDRGARVLVTGRNADNIRATQSELKSADVLRSDVTRMDDVDAMARMVEARFGRIDALFIFAGVAELAPFDAVTEESYDRQFAVNTKGAFFTAQRIAPLIDDGGSITMTTVTPSNASPTMAVYLATKAAVRAFAGGMAAELLDRRIRVNTVAPGFIDTPTLGIAGLSAEKRREFMAIGDSVTPMRRHGTPEEIARAALFLAFDATFTTGVDLPVDGGISQVDAP